METPEQPDDTTLEAPCPRCGKSVDAIFKFCPHCGLEVKAQVLEARSDLVEDDTLRKLSPDAQRRLVDFEQQFELLSQKIQSTPARSRAALADTSVVKLAVIIGIFIVLFLAASWYIIAQFLHSLSNRTAGL